MNFDVFISYSSKDATTAIAACAALEAAEIRCWIAPRDILPGARWGASIVRAINQCRVMVLIFSGNANGSAQVHREVDQAFSSGKAVVPLRVENIKPVDELAYYLNTVHWLDALTPPLERGLQQLTTVVKALLTTAEPAATREEATLDAAEGAQEARAEDERRAQEAQRLAEQRRTDEDVKRPEKDKEARLQREAAARQRPGDEQRQEEQKHRDEQAKAIRRAEEEDRQKELTHRQHVDTMPAQDTVRAEDERRDRAASFWASPFAITGPLIYAGSIVFTWWLVAVSTGPTYFYLNGWGPWWLSQSMSGVLLLVCYAAALVIQSLSSISRLITRLKSEPAAHEFMRYDDILALVTLPVIAGMTLFVMTIFGANQAAVSQTVSFLRFSVILLLFIFVSAAQGIFGMNSIVDRTLKSSSARYFAKAANIICATAIAVVAVIALAENRSNW